MGLNKIEKMRADELLVHQGLCETRAQAKTLIMAGKVRMGTEIIDKASRLLPTTAPLILESPPRFVSRAGEKLEGFLTHFTIPVKDTLALDIGASTGGFTDCLLQQGAKQVVCVDVGHGQLHYKLRCDSRVINIEKINARYLTPQMLPIPEFDLIVMDLSFISLTKVIENIWTFLKPQGILIALIKPQFEANKKEVDQGRGVIKDQIIHTRIVDSIQTFCLHHLNKSHLIGVIESPIAGTDGNKEFLLGLKKDLSRIIS